MTKQRFCPHCGERIADDEEQRFCMFCGETLKDEGLSDSKIIYDSPNGTTYEDTENHASFSVSYTYEPIYKPSGWQTLAAIIFFGAFLCNLILGAFFKEIYYYFLDSPTNIGLCRFFPLVIALALAILLKGAKNRATLIALTIWIISNLLAFASYFVLGIPSYSSWAWINDYVFPIIQSIIIPYSMIYAIALIIQNNTFSASCHSWLNLLTFCPLIDLCLIIGIKLFSSLICDYDLLAFSYVSMFEFYILLPLCAFGWWAVARSEIFGGPYDKETPCNFSPLNKYMAMAIIVPVILTLITWIIFNYAETLTNI